MELYASDMFFRGENEKEQRYDCCIHGKVVFKIADQLLSDNTEWCVSASAYRFLHTLFQNHFMGAEDFFDPLLRSCHDRLRGRIVRQDIRVR